MKKMKKGFTIVELVIVIGVIAILSAVLIPTFATLSSKAKVARAQSEVADAYTAYIVAKEDAALSQDKVLAKYENSGDVYYFVYDASKGWDNKGKDKPTGYAEAEIADDGNATDHVVFYAKN